MNVWISDNETTECSTTAVAQEPPSGGDAVQEQLDADAGPEQSCTDERLDQSHDNETTECSTTTVAPEPPSGDAVQEQSGADDAAQEQSDADAGPEQSYIQLMPAVLSNV